MKYPKISICALGFEIIFFLLPLIVFFNAFQPMFNFGLGYNTNNGNYKI